MDKSRRNYLKAAIGTLVGVGAVAVVKSCNRSMMPSDYRKKNLPYKIVDISKLDNGQRIVIEFRGLPINITKRTKEQIDKLKEKNEKLRDPFSKQSYQPEGLDPLLRSFRDDIFVHVNMCTHLGCSPQHINEDFHDIARKSKLPGGYICACHGAEFDAAGRVLKYGPAQYNMVIPNDEFCNSNKIKITEVKNPNVYYPSKNDK